MHFRQKLVFIPFLCCLLGCGDDEALKDGSVVDDLMPITDQIPVVGIWDWEIGRKKGATSVKVHWQLYATIAPNIDLAVRCNAVGSASGRWWNDWVIIPKGSNYSAVIVDTFRGGWIEIQPLPMVSIVGEGVRIDFETLRESLPAKTRDNHRIPEDYPFPLYKVGKPSRIEIRIE